MSNKKKNNSKQKNTEQQKKATSGLTEFPFSEEKYIELQAEAFYRAIKRVEKENLQKEKNITEKVKRKPWENICLFIVSLIIPWFDIGKNKFSNNIYDGMLVLPISALLYGGGTLFWLVGVLAFIISIIDHKTYGLTTCIFSVFIWLVGSLMILSGRAFGEEQDSMKIYAYSASIIALVSCIVSIVALLIK